MNAKQEAEKLPKLTLIKGRYSHTMNNGIEVYHPDRYSIEEVDKYIEAAENLLKELEATERKLAEAEKVVGRYKKYLALKAEHGESLCSYSEEVRKAFFEFEDFLSDYEASKGNNNDNNT